MAAVGHIGKLVRPITQKLFVLETIFETYNSSSFEVTEFISGISSALGKRLITKI